MFRPKSTYKRIREYDLTKGRLYFIDNRGNICLQTPVIEGQIFKIFKDHVEGSIRVPKNVSRVLLSTNRRESRMLCSFVNIEKHWYIIKETDK